MQIRLNSREKIIDGRYDLCEGIEFIYMLEDFYSEKNENEQVTVEISIDGKEFVVDELQLGYGDGLSYLAYLQSKLVNYFQDEVNGEQKIEVINQGIDKMTNYYQKNLATVDLSNVNEKMKQLRDPNKKRSRFDIKNLTPTQKKIIVSMVIVILIIGLIFLLIKQAISKNQTEEAVEISTEEVSEESVEETPTLTQLLNQKNYRQALTLYPDQIDHIYRTIFFLKEEGISHLQELLKEFPYPPAEFDLAYLQKDFKKVINMKAQANSEERLIQLAIAFIETGRFNDFQEIANSLDNEELKNMLQVYQYNYAIKLIEENKFEEVQEIQKNLNSETINQSLAIVMELQTKIDEINEILKQEGLNEDDRLDLETNRNELEASKQEIINQLKENVQ